MNRALAKRPPIEARMDEEDRLTYIKEQKAKLGLDKSFLLKSSKRVVADAQLRKDMPSLEFNGVYAWDKQYVFQPGEMTWSTHEFNKQSHIDFINEEQETRMEKKLLEDFEYRFKYLEHYTRVYKEDFPEKYQDVEIKTAK